MKKIFTILILSCIAMTAHSAIIDSGYCGGEGDGTNLTWEFSDDGTLTISGEGEMADMSNSYYGSYDILRVEISEGVTSIGYSAFNGCSSLESIVIPEGVTSIGYSAFGGCNSLESIVIPGSVTSIGDYAFGGCSSLANIEIPDIKPGMRIRHARFGEGVVIAMEGADGNVKATINFDNFGQKQLLLKFAKLQIIG